MINVWLAVERSNWRKFKENFERDENDEPKRKDFSKRAMRFLRNHAEGRWKAPTIRVQGTDYEFHILNLYVEEETVGDRQGTDDKRLWRLHRLKQILPGREFILGAWYADGSHTLADGRAVQYGQTVIPATHDEDENELTPESIEGDPVYPITNARMRKFLPDIVIRDEEGNETSRTPATEFTDVILYMGQPKRYV